ncbi:MAG: hypothetical protein IJW71_01680 [Clostridia bacterium]|nr:hypothetical protein [Clostridia bacterium]
MKTVYYQLRDGVPIPFTGKFVRVGDRIVAPPTAAALASLGYYPMEGVPAADAKGVRYAIRDSVIRVEKEDTE